jgi:hypothetical protein
MQQFKGTRIKKLYLQANIVVIIALVIIAIRLKDKAFVPLALITIMIQLTSCQTQCDCTTIDRKANDGETLYKICKYLIDNRQNTEPGNPCEWTIREIKNDTLNGKEITRIKLTCCYMGDEIIIDKEQMK